VSKKVLIMGIDGLDPVLLQQYVSEGYLPNFAAFMDEADFSPLQTTMPPLSPVAWSAFITGMDAGGHGIFDFLRRDPDTMLPDFAMAKTTQSDWNLSLGSWVLPLSGGKVEQLRQGRAFWELLEDEGIPTNVFRMPANYPPSSPGKTFSGMGTPDILGTPGTFSFYTDSPPEDSESISGGQVFEVEVRDYAVEAQLVGPANSFRRELKDGGFYGESEYQNPELKVDFQVFLDPEAGVAKFVVQDDEFILAEGEWSDWIRVDFEAIPYVVGISAIGRFYLQQVRPDFRLYVTPLQINPEDPAVPISTPADWAHELHQNLGYFYTQELPEDTKAFSHGIFTGEEFWEQAQSVYRERRKALDYFLSNFKEGLLFFYFSSVDQGCHMLWQYMDAQHPAFKTHEQLSQAIRVLYEEMDESLGEVLKHVDENTTLIVMSDHGFAPFYRGVNLNSWLLENGYVKLRDPSQRGKYPAFLNVDWTETTAYAVGLNGLYINVRGRERQGIVSKGKEYQELLDKLEKELLEIVDPESGQRAITSITQTPRDFHGPFVNDGPDIVVGYARGYRSSWKNPLGQFPEEIFVDNLDAWSGDHGMDNKAVPGVLLTNQKISMESPALHDLTVAVLDEYGVKKLPEMIGQDCLSAPEK
jgi:predicted AlkP superfamily phosphohydrolase/phosphomutase